MADRLAIIRAGRITPAAAPQDFYAHPLDPDMAAFVGEANLLTGTIDGTVRDHGARAPADPRRRRRTAPTATASIAATVLVRPEQVDVCARSDNGAEHDGLAGRVVRSDYHGHDALVTIRPVEPGAASTRSSWPGSTGNRVFARDADVTLRAHGSVLAWPLATLRARSQPRMSERPDGQDAIL